VFFFGYVVPVYNVDETGINFGGRQIVDYGSASPSGATLIE
jgi:hypothetical protein